MSRVRQSLSLNSSIASSNYEGHEDPETIRIKNHLKETLKSRIFLGRYTERRLADKNIGYRDIVVISPAEVELKRDILYVQSKLRAVCPNIPWVGITGGENLGFSNSSICLWTEIENQPFGPFWFQIKSLKFRPGEVIVQLKCLRYISDSYLEIEPILTGSGAKKTAEVSDKKLETSVSTLNETFTEIAGTFKGFLSITNVREFVTFLFAFVIAIFTGSTAFINFLGNFILALIREMSIFIRNSTPMFLGMLDFFSKIVGGFYLLLAMLFKQSVPMQTNRRAIGYYNRSGKAREDNHYTDNQFD